MERLNALYASALFELAMERGDMDESLSEAVFLRDTLQGTDIMRILLHPQIQRNEKHKLLTDTLSGNIHEDLLGFLNLAIEKNRQAYIISILEVYIGLIEKHKNIVTAKIITATELDDTQTAELRDILSDKLKKQIRLSVSVDPSVVAGPYIYVDGYYLDWTFKTRLRELTVYMKEGVKRT
jgi:F-type H+-transporting ATPase subunit delta